MLDQFRLWFRQIQAKEFPDISNSCWFLSFILSFQYFDFLNLFITFATFSKFAENAKLETLGTFFKEYGVLSVLIRSYLPSYLLYNTVLSSVHRQRLRGAQRTSSNFMLKKLTRRCMIPRMVMFRQLFY